ncbi:hypothetical protein GQ44DRAFT_752721 [Phaeosphaeriaceae sp. PMI808]|nr:hypothetical protein GQ44DRAFT_752721 [Phaeosphaeriaceae sp. PMI808]
MPSKILKTFRLPTSTRLTNPILSSPFRTHTHAFTTSRTLATLADSNFISQITAAEKTIANSDEPTKGGPTAAAQSHAGQELSSQVVHDITMGERLITGKDGPIQNGPTSIAQSMLSGGNPSSPNTTTTTTSSSTAHSGVLDADTIGAYGEDGPVRRGPTAKAQQHAGERITSEVLRDITKGEKEVTGGERVKGGADECGAE